MDSFLARGPRVDWCSARVSDAYHCRGNDYAQAPACRGGPVAPAAGDRPQRTPSWSTPRRRSSLNSTTTAPRIPGRWRVRLLLPVPVLPGHRLICPGGGCAPWLGCPRLFSAGITRRPVRQRLLADSADPTRHRRCAASTCGHSAPAQVRPWPGGFCRSASRWSRLKSGAFRRQPALFGTQTGQPVRRCDQCRPLVTKQAGVIRCRPSPSVRHRALLRPTTAAGPGPPGCRVVAPPARSRAGPPTRAGRVFARPGHRCTWSPRDSRRRSPRRSPTRCRRGRRRPFAVFVPPVSTPVRGSTPGRFAAAADGTVKPCSVPFLRWTGVPAELAVVGGRPAGSGLVASYTSPELAVAVAGAGLCATPHCVYAPRRGQLPAPTDPRGGRPGHCGRPVCRPRRPYLWADQDSDALRACYSHQGDSVRACSLTLPPRRWPPPRNWATPVALKRGAGGSAGRGPTDRRREHESELPR